MNLVYVDIGWPLLADDTYFTCISHSYLSLSGRQKKPLNMRFFSIASGKEQMFRKIIFVTLFLMWNHFFMSIIPPDLLAFLYCHLDRKLSEMKTSFFVFPMAYYKQFLRSLTIKEFNSVVFRILCNSQPPHGHVRTPV